MDFGFWSYVKRRVAIYNPNTRQELVDAIHGVMKDHPEKAIINMRTGVKERCIKYKNNNGGRFENK